MRGSARSRCTRTGLRLGLARRARRWSALRPPGAAPLAERPGLGDLGDTWETAADCHCCTRTSPTSPMSRWSIRTSHRRCCELPAAAGGRGDRDDRVILPELPQAPIAGWHAECWPADRCEHAQRERGAFVSPGLWVDRWHVMGSAGRTRGFTLPVHPRGDADRAGADPARLAGQPELRAGERPPGLLPIFSGYYRRVQAILETMQQVSTPTAPATRSTSAPTPPPSRCADPPQHGGRGGRRALT